MKDETIESSIKTIRVPNNTKKIMIGANHHFLRYFKKTQNSYSNDNLLNFIVLKFHIVKNNVINSFCYYFVPFR